MKILAVSDTHLPHFGNSEFLRQQYGDVMALVSCGDLDPDYLDYIASVLSLPLFFVRGNHDHRYTPGALGGVNLHRRIVYFEGVTLAGLEGSICYNYSGVQYTESKMAGFVLGMLPGLLWRRLLSGHGADVFVTHSPPLKINDAKDYAHRGFRSYRWLIRWGRPRYFIHGHVDLIDQRVPRETRFLRTSVVNINPSMVLDLGVVDKGS
jgi:predicted phosphodiesterase